MSRLVLPDALGPTSKKLGSSFVAVFLYKNQWKMIGNVMATTRAKRMADQEGENSHVAHASKALRGAILLLSLRAIPR